MLTNLIIKDFVLASYIEIGFRAGLSVISGESGAGKSMFVNALALVLGERGSAVFVRQGCSKAEISAVFDVAQVQTARTWLAQRELQQADECILRRVLSSTGASKSFINGSPATLEELRELGALLVSVQGQHAHQSLLRKQNQLAFIDDYGQLAAIREKYAAAYQSLLSLQQALAKLRNAEPLDEHLRTLLRHELAELEQLALSPAAYRELEEEHNRLSNAGDLGQLVRQALEMLQAAEVFSAAAGKSGILGNVSELTKLLTQAKDNKLQALGSELKPAEQLLQDLERELVSYQELLDYDPQYLASLDEKMVAIYALARKHDTKPEQLQDLAARRRQAWEEMGQLEEQISTKEQERQQQLKLCTELATELTKQRKLRAKKFDREITKTMKNLELNGCFVTVFNPLKKLGPTGDSELEFQLATSQAGKLLPLKNIASGGELARAALAINRLVALNSVVPCLLFDEADSGIGGKIAARVGQSLAELGKHAQVISITHQPQTAIYGDHHYVVAKAESEHEVISSINLLSEQDRKQEIARMLSGENLEEDAIKYAAKLISGAHLSANSI